MATSESREWTIHFCDARNGDGIVEGPSVQRTAKPVVVVPCEDAEALMAALREALNLVDEDRYAEQWRRLHGVRHAYRLAHPGPEGTNQ